MKYEEIGGLSLPKIGLGTWRIGGRSSADARADKSSLRALRSALSLGYTHFDTAEMYAAGHAEELLGIALRDSGIRRENLFLTSKVSPEHLAYQDVLKSCEGSLRRLGTEYLDLYLIHWPSGRMNLENAFRALNQLVEEGKVRHVGVSNFDLKLLRRSQELAVRGILTNQVPYSLRDRSYASNGVVGYCQSNEILVTAYSPLDEGSFRPSAAMIALAQSHSATPHQIALAWLCNQARVITIPMSADPEHLRENLEAAEISLSPDEIARLS